MPTTVQTPKIEAVVSNSYLQQENDLVQNIIDTIKTAPEIFKAVDISERSKGHKQRIIGELGEFKERKNKLEVEIEDLKSDFGSEDSSADLKKLEECELKLKAVSEAIPLIEQKLDYDSKFSREVRKNIEDTEFVIRFVLKKINVQLQEDIDAKVNDLLQTFSMYKSAIERVNTEQKLIPSTLLRWATLKDIIPEVKGLERLTPFNVAVMAGGIQRGLDIAKAAAAQGSAVV